MRLRVDDNRLRIGKITIFVMQWKSGCSAIQTILITHSLSGIMEFEFSSWAFILRDSFFIYQFSKIWTLHLSVNKVK
jgi:hypothetical protein